MKNDTYYFKLKKSLTMSIILQLKKESYCKKTLSLNPYCKHSKN